MTGKRVIWKAYQQALCAWWRFAGRRRVHTLGISFRPAPDTEWQESRRYRLPDGHPKSGIVAYGDLVQFHAAAAFVSGLPAAPVVVDVGAYHGLYAVALGKLVAAKGGVVIAVEPNPRSARILESNVKRNSLEAVVRVERVAVGDHAGSVVLSDQGSQSVRCEACTSGWEVPLCTLAQLLKTHSLDRVDLLIVDVEGMELDVLRGYAWGDVPCGMILCEMHPCNWAELGVPGEAVAAFLKQRGLRCVDVYWQEHARFDGQEYIGPCLLLPEKDGH